MKSKTILLTLAAIGLAASAAFGQAVGVAAPAPPAPPPKWESSFAAGLTVTRGNSDSVTATAGISTAKKWDLNEVSLSLAGQYGETDDKKSAEMLRGIAQYNRLFTERVFGYLRFEGYHDAVADIDYRFTFSPGAGYYFIKNTNTTLRAEVGPGYVFERKAGHVDDYFSMRFAERFDHKFSDQVKLWESAEVQPQVDRWGNYVVNAELGVETALSKTMNLRAYLQDTYYNEPSPGRKRNDLTMVLAVAYKF
jgi:putative salt-induced outer membrane protein YdiY